MGVYWTRPEKVEAVCWHPQMGVLGTAHPVGCTLCGSGYATGGFYNSCVNPAEHDPIRHPHHLLLETPQGN